MATTDALSSPVRRSIMSTLEALPTLAAPGDPTREHGLTAADLASQLHLHVTTVRFHLERLADADLIRNHDERRGVGRPRKKWVAVPPPADPNSRSYMMLASVLAEAMAQGDPDAEDAGRRWALANAATLVGSSVVEQAATPGVSWLAKVGAVVDVLDQWGYHPSVTLEDEGRVATVCLKNCPLAELARTNPTIACGVHRGVIAGTLQALNATDSSVRLDAFVEPDLCIARISEHGPREGADPTPTTSERH